MEPFENVEQLHSEVVEMIDVVTKLRQDVEDLVAFLTHLADQLDGLSPAMDVAVGELRAAIHLAPSDEFVPAAQAAIASVQAVTPTIVTPLAKRRARLRKLAALHIRGSRCTCCGEMRVDLLHLVDPYDDCKLVPYREVIEDGDDIVLVRCKTCISLGRGTLDCPCQTMKTVYEERPNIEDATRRIISAPDGFYGKQLARQRRAAHGA
ncbi:hypothetical protein [Nocardioides panzhihuensis]|uniref:Uncharacterized protein n=1 Tax=Nocardioides panzhihuensis TaxID=860243 RepID=A0A7Z0IVY1_9ACTN|nr:hypothetical protein [Nocardioides panzhihuensis]NYI81243.1 hypothetical protein [Nocardioides panzhihuensis]